MRFRPICATAALLLLTAPLASASDASAGLLLADREAAHAAIVLPPEPSEGERKAAAELNAYLEKMGLAPLPMGDDGQGARVYLGRADAFPYMTIDVSELVPQGFVVHVGDDAAYLLGADDLGTLFAVYDVLEDLGCRWFFPGPNGEVVPSLERVALEPGRRVETPDFFARSIGAGGPGFADWARRNRLSGGGVAQGHNLTHTLPPEQYFEEHPEYYALVDGVRQTTQLCTTNPEVIRLVIERINTYFDEHPDATSYSLCPDDNHYFCECANCRALDVIESDPYYPGRPTLTDRLMHFLNEVARGIQKKHPGKFVTSYAYVHYTTPPVREKVDPHVIIVFVTGVYCGGHGVGDPSCPTRQEMKDVLAGWLEATRNVYIYDYDPMPYNADAPCPLFGARMREMPVYKAMGVKGLFIQSTGSWATLFPNNYVTAKLMWDADLDPEALLDDLCEKFFAEAAAPMRRYLTELEAAFSTYRGRIHWGLVDYPAIFTPPRMARLRALLDEAATAASSETTGKRVAMMRAGFDYLEAYLAIERGLDSFAAYEAATQRVDALLNGLAAADPHYINLDLSLGLLNELINRDLMRRYARELGLITEWMLIGPFDNRARLGHDRVYPPETSLDLQAQYQGVAGSVRWKRHVNPPHDGFVDFTTLFQPKDWVVAYALGYVTAPRATSAQLRVGSNDSVAVWLAGEKVMDHNVTHATRLDQHIAEVTLPAGTVPLLVKVGQTAKNWGFVLRLTDAEGNPLRDLTFSLAPHGERSGASAGGPG